MSGDGRLRPSLDRYRELAASAPAGARIPVEREIQVSDPYETFRRICDDESDAVFLETTGGQAGWGYFAIDPVERVTSSPIACAREHGSSPSLAAIAGLLDRETLVRGPCEVPYPCGLFGWLSYDLVRELEDLPDHTRDDRGLPHVQFGLFDRVAAWKEPREPGRTTVHVVASPRVRAKPAASYARARSGIETLVDAVDSAPARPRPRPPTNGAASFASESGREAYADRVRAIKRYIRDGDTFQVNISHRLSAPATVPARDVYAALRQVNPAPYSGYMRFRGIELVSASPELLLSVDGKQLYTEPIAGTRPRGSTTAEDEQLEAELSGDEKERAEHAMLVDLERNDLGKVSAYGSVAVEEYRRVDRYSEVMHLVSLVKGRLREDVSLAGVCRADPLTPANASDTDRLCAAIAAVFPGGTITGAPKPRTMAIIDELETTRRGPYTGSMAVLGFDQRATLNIIIRTIVRTGEEFHLRVGAGIVHDSVPDREYEETMDKARALVTALNAALADGAELEVVG